MMRHNLNGFRYNNLFFIILCMTNSNQRQTTNVKEKLNTTRRKKKELRTNKFSPLFCYVADFFHNTYDQPNRMNSFFRFSAEK